MMKVTVRQLVLASAIGACAFAAQAQGDDATTRAAHAAPAATPQISGDRSQAQNDYEAAQVACGHQNAETKADCLRDAQTEYENASRGTMSPGTAPSPSSTEMAGSASGTASMSSEIGTAGSDETSGAANSAGR